MEEMPTKMADEEYEYIVPAKLNTQEKEENIFKAQDPFIKSWEELKSLAGLEDNVKRRITRQVNKAMTQEGYLATNSNIDLLSAPNKFIEPSDVFDGPVSTSLNEPTVPTFTRLPLGN